MNNTQKGKLQNKVALVTGASKGIGAAITKSLAAEGASVVVNYASDKQGAKKVSDDITANGGQVITIQANITDKADIVHLLEETKIKFGRLDILVNNAGVLALQPLEYITEEHFYRHFNLNVLALLMMTKMALDAFEMKGGNIINISSLASTSTPATASVYSASKAAVDAITLSLSKELGPRGIRVNAVNPGMVITEGIKASGLLEGEFRKQIDAQTPLGRIGTPEDVAKSVVFLASDDAGWITGEMLHVTGGKR